MAFSFNASRLRSVSSSKNVQSTATLSSSGQCTELAKSKHYKILKFSSKLPSLSHDEVVIDSFTDKKTKYAVQITNQRVIVYDYKTSNSQSAQSKFKYDFPYSLNDYGIYPQVQIIPNDIQQDNPGIVLIDSVLGDIRFVETIDLAPSLDILPNEHSLKIKLRRGEFIATGEYFNELGLILTTNYRKVLLVSFKDQMGKCSLNYDDVSSSTSFIHLFMNPGLLYNIESYQNSNKISSVKCIDEGSLSKKIVIQEEEGKLSIIQYIKSNGLNSFFECNIMPYLTLGEESRYKIRDIEYLEDGEFLLLVSQSETLCVFTIKLFGNEINEPVVISKYIISKTTSSADIKLNVLLNKSVGLISSSRFLVFFEVNADPELKWEDSIDFKTPNDVFFTNVIDDNLATISTNSSILLLELVSCGKKSTPSEFVKLHINQYLKYNNNNSPIGFSVEQPNMQILKSDVEEAVGSIIKEIMKSSSADFKNISTLSHNLNLRVEYLKSLSQFASINLDISDNLKLDITVGLEKLMLALEIYTLIDLPDLKKLLSNYKLSIRELFTSSVESEILNVLTIVAQETMNVTNSKELLERSKIINKIITNSYVNAEHDVRYNTLNIQYSYETKTSPIFYKSINPLIAVNGVVKEISKRYSTVLDSASEIDLKSTIKKLLFDVSLFLYYATSDTLSFSKFEDSSLSNNNILQLFNDNRESWTKIFILTDNQEKMIELSDKYQDFKSLSEVLESEREILNSFDSDDPGDQTLIETHTDQINSKFDFYFTKYGYDFAETLFSYYVTSHKVNILLENFKQYSTYVTKFLDSKKENWKFSWIHYIHSSEYLKASKSLSTYAISSDEEPIENKKLQLNIAKLSFLASPFTSNDDILKEIESNISVIQLQHKFYRLINVKYQHIKPNGFRSEYLKDHSLLFLKEELSTAFSSFLNNKGITFLNLINLLTLINLEESVIVNNFFDIFSLISLLKQKAQSYDFPVFSGLVKSTKELDILEKLTWKRLFLLTSWPDSKELREPGRLFFSVLEKLTNSHEIIFSIPQSSDEILLSYNDLQVLNVSSDILQQDYMEENLLFEKLFHAFNLERLLERIC